MIKRTFILLASFGLLAACGNQGSEGSGVVIDLNVEEDAAPVAEESNDVFKSGGLTISPFIDSQKFPEAKLSLNAPAVDAMVEGTMVSFDFGVENYQLGVQSPETGSNGLANSAKGQHIHLIMDNDPYSAHYEAQFEKEFEPGHHVAIAFLSRSFHESVKNPNAFQVFQFTTGEQVEGDTPMDMTQPMLFYSRPKGEYSGEGAQKVLFDFYLHNTELSEDGNKVLATINDELEFTFDKWQPYVIEGLPMGENTINIKLLDSEGQLVDTKMNDVTRTFTLKP